MSVKNIAPYKLPIYYLQGNLSRFEILEVVARFCWVAVGH